MNPWMRLLQQATFVLIVRPFLAILLGLRVEHRERLPTAGPAIIVANHNSHLDTLVLMALMPLGLLSRVRPVAAADHFGRGIVGFLARRLLGALLVQRRGNSPSAMLKPVVEAMDREEIVIFFPEGSRGEPEVMSAFKQGIGYLTASRPQVPVVPVYLHGLGKCMPKASLLFLPFDCAAVVGPPAALHGLAPAAAAARLKTAIETLAATLPAPRWAAAEDA